MDNTFVDYAFVHFNFLLNSQFRWESVRKRKSVRTFAEIKKKCKFAG